MTERLIVEEERRIQIRRSSFTLKQIREKMREKKGKLYLDFINLQTSV